MLTTVRIVKCLIDSEVTEKDASYVEYFDKPGYFYPLSNLKPDGIGLNFDNDDKNWITSGKVIVISEIKACDSVYGKIRLEYYKNSILDLANKIESLHHELLEKEDILEKLLS
jgi:hypothetical protein